MYPILKSRSIMCHPANQPPVYGLQSGTLTAPPDDPITNWDYVDAMGASLIVEADSDKDEVIPELSVVYLAESGAKKNGVEHE